jgi:uncharacterized protein YxeA
MAKLVNHSSNGFTMVEILSAITVIIVIGVAGFFVVKHKDNSNHSNSSVSHSTSSTSASKNKTNQSNGTSSKQAAANTSSGAVNLVQNAYDTALAYVNKTTNADQGEIDSIKSSLSPSLYSSLSAKQSTGPGYDLILCAQERPSSITASLSSSSNNSATVNVNETFGSDSSQVVTTVDLPSLKLTSISCPAQ